MSRYIDADKLKEECYKFTNDVSRSAMAFVQGQINAAPTADVVEVRHGCWVRNEDHNAYESEYFCSECLADGSYDVSNEKYCYNCGAKMDGERIEK